jgi:hypothetical protein
MLVRFKHDVHFVAKAGEEKEINDIDAEWCLAAGHAELVQQQKQKLETTSEPQQWETR